MAFSFEATRPEFEVVMTRERNGQRGTCLRHADGTYMSTAVELNWRMWCAGVRMMLDRVPDSSVLTLFDAGASPVGLDPVSMFEGAIYRPDSSIRRISVDKVPDIGRMMVEIELKRERKR